MSAQPSARQPGSGAQDSPRWARPAAHQQPRASFPANAYTHVIESGESLYTIARHYDVTAQAIMQANGISSPDKILSARSSSSRAAPISLAKKAPPRPRSRRSPRPRRRRRRCRRSPAASKTAAIADPKPVDSDAADRQPRQPTQVADRRSGAAKTSPAAEPAMSGADKFRWPVSGKVITDFIASKGTGINIDAPEGTAVRAAENGTVIYVGSGVEGYGNLVLIRHPNGYVSAYAHLKVDDASPRATPSAAATPSAPSA